MSALGLVLACAGVLAMGWGIYAVFGEARKRQLLGVIVAPLGVLVALVGALLWFVPGFFAG